MTARSWIIFSTRSAGDLLRFNGGESLSHRRLFQNSSSLLVENVLGPSYVPDTNTDPTSYIKLLKLLGSHKAMQEGKYVHHLIISSAFDSNDFVAGYLVQMYGACAAFDDAVSLFYKLQERTVFVWNFLIRACARHGENEMLFDLFEQMQQRGSIPTKVTFVSVFDACSTVSDFKVGHRMHALIVNSPYETDVIVGTALVKMYCCYGQTAVAYFCFDKLLERDVIAWTSIISALSQQAHWREAFGLFEQMLQESIMPNEVTFIGLCSSCIGHASMRSGEQVCARVSSFVETPSVALENALITMYAKCGSLEPAESIFKAMRIRSLVSWTAMVSVFSQCGYAREAYQYFSHMLHSGYLPDNVLFTTILSACTNASLLTICKYMHAMLSSRSTGIDVIVGTVLVYTYGKCQDLVLAKATFDSLIDRNIFSWNALISAFVQNRKDLVAGSLFDRMKEEGILPNNITSVSVLNACANDPLLLHRGVQLHTCSTLQEVEVQNALIDMYGKNNRLEVAEDIFDTTVKKDSITWTTLISLYVQHEQTEDAIRLFERMCHEGLLPDEATFVSILSVCINEVDVMNGHQIHAFIIEMSYENNVVVSTALVSMYGRCNDVEDARSVFDSMGGRNGVSWNAMIAIHEQAGQPREALELFRNMQYYQLSPDYITFVSIISSCIALFASMEGMVLHAYIIESGCIIDVVLISAIINMYGKSGNLEDARRLFDKMGERNVVSWNTMIALYAQHGLGVGALTIFEEMQTVAMLPNHITFVNILGACSHCGFIYEACYYFLLMEEGFMLSPTSDIYVCLIDLFSRAGCLDQAAYVVHEMPLLPSCVSFMALLGACRYKEDIEQGACVAKHVCEIEPDNFAPHLVLTSLYAAIGQSYNANSVMNLFDDTMKESGFILDDGEWHDTGS
ncbi:hypothetical protein KP509_09G084300 [Ceratopteris richardii]|nr:hypothetical protein KP509_09G084300 [Ceratopteris richardii]